MSEKMTEEEFANKVEWEGGLYDALFIYGLKSGDLVDGPLKDAIEKIESQAKPFNDAMDEAEWLIESLLEDCEQ